MLCSPIWPESLGEVCDMLAARDISVATVQKVTSEKYKSKIDNSHR